MKMLPVVVLLVLINGQSENSEDEMAISRILFLSTYHTTMDFQKLINDHALAANIHYVSYLPCS